MVRKPPHQPTLHSPCPAANSPREPCKQTHAKPGPEILLTPQTQEGGSVLPTPCWQKGKKKLNGSCRMPHVGSCRRCRETRSGDVELLPWLHSLWLLLYLNQVFPSLETQAWGFQSTITCMSCRMAGNLFPWLCFWTRGLRQLSEKSALPLPTARNNFPTVTDASCMQQKAPGVAMQTSSSCSLSLKHKREMIHMENITGSLWGTSTHVLKLGYGEAGGERTPLLRTEKFPLCNQNISQSESFLSEDRYFAVFYKW